MDSINMHLDEDDYKLHVLWDKSKSQSKEVLFKVVLLHFSDAQDLGDTVEEWNIDSFSDNMMVQNSISGFVRKIEFLHLLTADKPMFFRSK